MIQQNGDWISHPRSPSPINQFDGTSDPCDRADDRGQLSDANDDNQILCAMCNLKMTPTHQCWETDKPQLKLDYDKFMNDWEGSWHEGRKAFSKIQRENTQGRFRLYLWTPREIFLQIFEFLIFDLLMAIFSFFRSFSFFILY